MTENTVLQNNTNSSKKSIPIYHKYNLTVDEAALYFRIGENKLRQIINNNRCSDFILWNGNRPLIKRVKFENYIDSIHEI